MKTSKLNYRFGDLLRGKQIPYYLRHFVQLSVEVFSRYPNLFRKKELDRYTSFYFQSIDAISLYLRLMSRRGPWFKISSLIYPELDVTRAIEELTEDEFISASLPEKDEISSLYPVLTKNECASLLGTSANIKKDDLWVKFDLDYDRIKNKLPAMVCVREDLFFKKLLTIYFGNPYQDLSTFVVEELEHLKHIPIKLSSRKLWKTYQQFADYAAFVEWENQMSLLYLEGDLVTYRRLVLKKLNEFITNKNNLRIDKTFHLQRTATYRLMKFLIHYAAIENRYFPDKYPLLLKKMSQFAWPDDLISSHVNLQIILAKKGKDKKRVEKWHDEFFKISKPHSIHDEVLLDKTECWLAGKRRSFPAIPVFHLELELIRHDGVHPYFKAGDGIARVEEAVIFYLQKEGWVAIHTENFIPRFAGVLLFLEEIYLPLSGQFQSHFQNGPLDFRSKSFYRRRKKKINEKISYYQDHPEKIAEVLWDNYRQYQNYALPGIYLKNLENDQINQIIYTIPAEAWLSIATRFIYHPGANGTGFPDIAAINAPENTYKFIEVKSPGDKISDSQRYWMKYLADNEVECEIFQIVTRK